MPVERLPPSPEAFADWLHRLCGYRVVWCSGPVRLPSSGYPLWVARGARIARLASVPDAALSFDPHCVCVPSSRELYMGMDAPGLWLTAAMLALLPAGGLIVHAAGVVVDGVGVVLGGVSGVGKSTLSALLEARLPGAVLSDERVVIQPTATGLRLHGTLWQSSAGLARPGVAPLGCFAFPVHGRDNQCRKLARREILARMIPLVSVPWQHPQLSDMVLPTLGSLLDVCPVCEFRARPEPGAVDALFDWITSVRREVANR